MIALDIASEMLAQARTNFPNVEFIQGDASNFVLSEPVDAIFSNAALHWVLDDDGVGRSVARALKPGGRFVAELGGHGNIQSIVDGLRAVIGPDAHIPWHYPTVGEYSTPCSNVTASRSARLGSSIARRVWKEKTVWKTGSLCSPALR